jgi:hypothetical protein
VLRLERAEQSFLGTQDLDGATRRLREVHERAGMGDKPCANKLTNKCCQVGGQRLHAVAQVISEVLAMLSEVDDLLGQG